MGPALPWWERRATWLGLLGLTLAVRVGTAIAVSSHRSSIWGGDTPSYVGSARALLEHHRFTETATSSVPMHYRTPGYPLLVAVLLWLRDDLRWVSVAQAALSVAAVALVFLAARRVLSTPAALVAAAVVAIDPLQLAASGVLMTESLSTTTVALLALAGLVVFAGPAERTRAWQVGGLGLALAAATMVRPTTYYLPIVVVVLLALRYRSLGARRLVTFVAVLLVPVVVVVGGWQVRNLRETGSSQFSSIESINLYCYRAAEVEAGRTLTEAEILGGHLPGCRAPWTDPPGPCPKGWPCPGPGEQRGPYYERMGSEGRRILVHHPVGTAVMTAKGAGRLLLGPGTETMADYLSVAPSTALKGLLTLWSLPVLLLTIGGVAVGVLGRRERAAWVFLALTLGYVLLLSSGTEAYSRFRTPVLPLYGLFVGLAVEALAGRRASIGR